MTESRTPRVVNVEVVPADGYVLEIDGTGCNPFITTDDATGHLQEVVAECVREALDIPEGVPLTLNIATPADGRFHTD